MTLIQVAQYADDLDRAAAFYTDLLGAEPTGRFEPPGLLFFDLGGTRLLLELGAPSAVLYNSVADIDATIERLRAGGVEIVSDPHIIFSHADGLMGPAGTDEWQAFVRDSEGNLVGLVEQRKTPTASSAVGRPAQCPQEALTKSLGHVPRVPNREV